jgi:CRP-like cAMP-binding protein
VEKYLQESKNMVEVNKLKDGDSFGQLALISNKPRNASIITIENTHFAVINKKDYMRVLAMIHVRKINEKIAFLWSIPIFSKLTKTSLTKFSEPF